MASIVDDSAGRSVPNWGKSILIVESVQELSKTQQETIPERYIRRGEERPTPTAVSDHQLNIPIIDMANISEGNSREPEIKKLAQACEEWGFFQIVNHGIANSLIDAVKRAGKEFFQLPLEEKQKYAINPGDLQGYGKTFVVSEQQKLDWGDALGLIMFPSNHRDLTVWPVQPADFREIVDTYNTEIRTLAGKLLSLIAETLELNPDFFDKKFRSPYQKMRMNYYPPCPQPDLVFGLSPHADMTGITVLLQDDGVVGLNIHKGEQWIAVQPIPYALVINIGNLMEVMTNGRYKSTEHRALTNSFRARLSIGVFYAPGFDAEIGPALEIIDKTHAPCLFRNFIHEDYIQYYYSRSVEGKHSLYEYAAIQSSQQQTE